MNDRQAILETIRANPDDPTPRLVFADWLQDRGQDETANRIRYCTAARQFLLAIPGLAEEDVVNRNPGFLRRLARLVFHRESQRRPARTEPNGDLEPPELFAHFEASSPHRRSLWDLITDPDVQKALAERGCAERTFRRRHGDNTWLRRMVGWAFLRHYLKPIDLCESKSPNSMDVLEMWIAGLVNSKEFADHRITLTQRIREQVPSADGGLLASSILQEVGLDDFGPNPLGVTTGLDGLVGEAEFHTRLYESASLFPPPEEFAGWSKWLSELGPPP